MTGNPSILGRGAYISGLAGELDPPAAARSLAGDRYEDLGSFVKDVADETRPIKVYPQGSRNLGTTNAHPDTGEFDIDLVFSIGFRKRELSQKQLNQCVGDLLRRYVRYQKQFAGALMPSGIEPGKRAWTLHYDDGFHMDLLPVVPDVDKELRDRRGDPSWLTDKQLTRWQATNPQGFADWFHAVSQREREVELRKRAEVTVDLLPDDHVKTTLQVTVQVLKFHRDRFFSDDPDKLAPPSALITALAARAYEIRTPHGGPLADVVEEVLAYMPALLATDDAGDLAVLNPVCDRENYADRYEGRRDKRAALEEWLAHAAADLGRIATTQGMNQVSKAIDETFGDGLGSRVTAKIVRETQGVRERGHLSSSEGSGSLRIDPGHPTREHRFYGDPSA
ncbi:MAG: nucleotidyltransferase [Nitriliruptor sp.]